MDKDQRKLFKAAEASQKEHREERHRRPKKAVVVAAEPVHGFCATCYAVTDAGTCPNCVHKRTSYQKFCRRCLWVHEVNEGCTAWSPTSGDE